MDTPIPRVKLRPVFVVMALGCFVLFLGGPLVLGVAALLFAPQNVSVYLAPGALVFFALMLWTMSSSFQWIELDNGVLRGRRLLTRRMFERPVAHIVRVSPLTSNALGPLENALADAMMGTSNRGYLLRFRDGSKLGLVRGDMAGLDEFLKVLGAEIAARCPHLEPP